MIKLCVGIADPAELREWQRARFGAEPRHLTRQRPRRAEEIVDGGSLYWVISGMALLRQRVVRVDALTRADGTACAALVFDPALVAVTPRPVRAFQGWRYLQPDDAPPDLDADQDAAAPGAGLPGALARELRGLGLL